MAAGDIFILDRGFRNCVSFLRERNYEVLIPTCKRGQLTWQEANDSRIRTKLRWVIESANGMLKKQFKILDKVKPNKSLGKIKVEFQIAGALHNMFGKRLTSDHENFKEISDQMKLRRNKPNLLQSHVNENNWNMKKRDFVSIDQVSDVTFPTLSEVELKMITLGTYQLKQANGYLVEHFSPHEPRKFECLKDKWGEKDVIRAKLQSRHKKSRIYNIYVSFDENDIDEWYCSCFMGARTVGCCSHVAAVIVYFATGRRIPKEVAKVDYFMNLFQKLDDIVLVDGESDISDQEE